MSRSILRGRKPRTARKSADAATRVQTVPRRPYARLGFALCVPFRARLLVRRRTHILGGSPLLGRNGPRLCADPQQVRRRGRPVRDLGEKTRAVSERAVFAQLERGKYDGDQRFRQSPQRRRHLCANNSTCEGAEKNEAMWVWDGGGRKKALCGQGDGALRPRRRCFVGVRSGFVSNGSEMSAPHDQATWGIGASRPGDVNSRVALGHRIHVALDRCSRTRLHAKLAPNRHRRHPQGGFAPKGCVAGRGVASPAGCRILLLLCPKNHRVVERVRAVGARLCRVCMSTRVLAANKIIHCDGGQRSSPMGGGGGQRSSPRGGGGSQRSSPTGGGRKPLVSRRGPFCLRPCAPSTCTQKTFSGLE